jgi:hypothetical protein
VVLIQQNIVFEIKNNEIYLSALTRIKPFLSKKLFSIKGTKRKHDKKNSSALQEKIIFTFYNDRAEMNL